MNSIAFIDTEIEPRTLKILDIGGIRADGCTFHKASIPDFIQFLNGTKFICGHNVINHDIKYISRELNEAKIKRRNQSEGSVL